MNLQNLLKKTQEQAKEWQKKMEQIRSAIDNTDYVGQSGGGKVTVTMRGGNKVVGVSIDPSMLGDKEILEDLIVAAFNNAKKKADDDSAAKMGSLGIPSEFLKMSGL